MKISEVKTKGFFKTRVNIGEFFNVKKNDVWIELSEPCEDETFRASPNDVEKNVELLKGMWRNNIVGHNFENDDGTPATKDAVIMVIEKKGWCIQYIIQEWMNALPLVMKKDSN